jgi:hypothetical protein
MPARIHLTGETAIDAKRVSMVCVDLKGSCVIQHLVTGDVMPDIMDAGQREPIRLLEICAHSLSRELSGKHLTVGLSLLMPCFC